MKNIEGINDERSSRFRVGPLLVSSKNAALRHFGVCVRLNRRLHQSSVTLKGSFYYKHKWFLLQNNDLHTPVP